MRKVLLATALLVATSVSQAQGERDSRFLAGAAITRATYDVEDMEFKDTTTGWRLFGGYQFNRWLSVEVGYIDGGTVAEEETIGTSLVRVEEDFTAWQGSVIGTLPLNDSFGVFGRAGISKWKGVARGLVNGIQVIEEDEDGSDPYFGAGIFAVLDDSLLRLEYNILNTDNIDVGAIDFSIVWRF